MGVGGVGFYAALAFGYYQHVSYLVPEQVRDDGGFVVYAGHHLVGFGCARSVAEAPSGGYGGIYDYGHLCSSFVAGVEYLLYGHGGLSVVAFGEHLFADDVYD